MYDLAAAAEFSRTVGFPGLIFIIWYLFWRGEKQKWELQLEQQHQLRVIQKDKEDADRKEHMHKWNSLVENHEKQLDQLIKSHDSQMAQLVEHFNGQMERQFELSDRQAQAIELTTQYLHKLIEKIDNINKKG